MFFLEPTRPRFLPCLPPRTLIASQSSRIFILFTLLDPNFDRKAESCSQMVSIKLSLGTWHQSGGQNRDRSPFVTQHGKISSNEKDALI